MSVVNQIFKNSVINISGKLISLTLGLVSVAVMTRYLGQEGFGFYTTVTVFLQFFGILVDFGISLTTVQMISAPGANLEKLMRSVHSFRVLTAGIFLALAPIVVWFFPYNNYIKWGVLITAGSFFASAILQTLNGLFQKELKMWQVTIAEIVGRVFLVVSITYVCLAHLSIYWLFAAITASSVLNLILVYSYSRNYLTWKWETDRAVWQELWHKTWPIALSITFNLIYLKTDILILSLTRSQSEVGLYGATYRVIDILTMLPAVFMGIVLPVITKYFQENNRPALFHIMQKAFDALAIIAVPVVLGSYFLGRQLMVFVAGSQFAESGEILKVLILASGAIMIGSLFGYSVVGINKQRQMMWGYLTTALITLIGYLIFIPRFGYWGAAWMTVFSEVLVMCWTAWIVTRTLKFFPSLTIFLKALPATALMCAMLYLFRDLHVLILLIIAAAVYFPMLYLFGGISRDALLDLIGQRGKPAKL